MKVLPEVWLKSKQPPLINFKKHNCLFLRPALLVIILFLFSSDLFSQTKQDNIFELSKRVGSDLDSVEIEYFNVFPEIDFVKSAVYRKDNFGNILLLLSFSNGRDSTVTISKMAGEELSRLIDGFESVADKEDLINWKLLPGFSPNRLNYFENTGRNITVNTKEGSFSGRILIVSDSSIFIWQKKGGFQPNDCDRFIKHFQFSEINSLEIRPSISSKLFGASIGAGLAVGAIQLGFNLTDSQDYLFSSNSLILLGIGGLAGAVGGFFFDGITSIGRYKEIDGNYAKYNRVRNSIRGNAMFDKIYPPELSKFLGTKNNQ